MLKLKKIAFAAGIILIIVAAAYVNLLINALSFSDTKTIKLLKESDSYTITELSSNRADDSKTFILYRTYEMKNNRTGKIYNFKVRQGHAILLNGLNNYMTLDKYYFNEKEYSSLFHYFNEQLEPKVKSIINSLGIPSLTKTQWNDIAITSDDDLYRVFEKIRTLPEVEETYRLFLDYQNATEKDSLLREISVITGIFTTNSNPYVSIFEWASSKGIASKI